MRFITCIRLFFCILIAANVAADDEQKEFIIGTQNIDYFPHYDFSARQDQGYAWALLEAFANEHNISFVYLPLPIKRLHIELDKGSVDFAFPDNPNWRRSHIQSTPTVFSEPLAYGMGSTIVDKKIAGRGLRAVQTLSVPFGFTPVMWFPYFENNRIRVINTPDARSALEMLLRGRAQAADIEYHVAKYLMRNSRQYNQLVFDPSLPYDIVGFSLSTIKHQEWTDKLTLFINNNPALISQLQKRYKLERPEDVLMRAKRQRSRRH